MPRMGAMGIPEITFSEAVKIARSVKGKNIKTWSTFTSELGYSPKSHGGSLFYKWLALSKLYGLLESSRKSIALSRLGERIISPLNDKDAAEAMAEAIRRVPVLNSLYEGLGTAYHEQDFKPVLSKVTNTAPTEVAEFAKRTEEIYQDALKYFRPSEGAPTGRGRAPGRQSGDGDKGGAGGDRDQIRPNVLPDFNGPTKTLFQENEYYLQVALSTEAIEAAVDHLEILKKRIGAKPVGEPPKGP